MKNPFENFGKSPEKVAKIAMILAMLVSAGEALGQSKDSGFEAQQKKRWNL